MCFYLFICLLKAQKIEYWKPNLCITLHHNMNCDHSHDVFCIRQHISLKLVQPTMHTESRDDGDGGGIQTLITYFSFFPVACTYTCPVFSLFIAKQDHTLSSISNSQCSLRCFGNSVAFSGPRDLLPLSSHTSCLMMHPHAQDTFCSF